MQTELTLSPSVTHIGDWPSSSISLCSERSRSKPALPSARGTWSSWFQNTGDAKARETRAKRMLNDFMVAERALDVGKTNTVAGSPRDMTGKNRQSFEVFGF